MISQIRNSIFSKILWGMMGIYLLNISVDTADPNPEYIPESLSINDQESIVEIVLEKILGYEDAIKEYDDNDSEDLSKKSNLKMELISQWIVDSSIEQPIIKTSKLEFPNYKTHLRNGFQKLDTPPPKI